MALQRYEGFDHFDQTVSDPTDLRAKGIGVIAGLSAFTYGAGQFGGQYIETDDADDVLSIPFITPVSTFFVGFWFKYGATVGTDIIIADWNSSGGTVGTPHVDLRVNTADGLEIFGDGILLEASANGVLTPNTWHFVEVSALINATTGTWDVRLDGDALLSGTGADTAANTDLDVSVVRLMGNDLTTVQFDDLYIVDTTATAGHPVTFLGKVTVALLVPSADGFQNDMTAVGVGSSNYERVSDTPGPDFDTSYVHSTTNGAIESYAMTDIGAGYTGSTVIAVQTSMLAKKDAPGSKTARTRVRSNVTDSLGTSRQLTANYRYSPPEILVVDPDTSSAWTTSGVNAIECGWELTS